MTDARPSLRQLAREASPGRGPGRPTRFTPEVREQILAALRAGNFRKVACARAGISTSAFHEWLRVADHPDAPPEYVEFAEAVASAEAEAEADDLALIRRAAQDGRWQAAAWFLSRRYPDRWAARAAQSEGVSGDRGGHVQAASESMESDIRALESTLRRRALSSGTAPLEPLAPPP